MSSASARRRSGPLPRLHVVTDDATVEAPGFLDRAARVLEEGGERLALHLRAPSTTGACLYEWVGALAPSARDAGAFLIVNDRVDVALAWEVDGAHLGARSLPAPAARAILGPDVWLGASAHGVEEILALAAEEIDYLFLGHVFETPSHRDVVGLGVEGVRHAMRSAGEVPVVVIGGITADRVEPMIGAGGYGVAVARGVWAARDPSDAVRGYLDALERGGGSRGGN